MAPVKLCVIQELWPSILECMPWVVCHSHMEQQGAFRPVLTLTFAGHVFVLLISVSFSFTKWPKAAVNIASETSFSSERYTFSIIVKQDIQFKRHPKDTVE